MWFLGLAWKHAILMLRAVLEPGEDHSCMPLESEQVPWRGLQFPERGKVCCAGRCCREGMCRRVLVLQQGAKFTARISWLACGACILHWRNCLACVAELCFVKLKISELLFFLYRFACCMERDSHTWRLLLNLDFQARGSL